MAVSVYPWEIAIEPVGAEAAPGSTQNHLAAEIVSITTLGNRVRLGLAGPQPLAAEITAASADSLGLRAGTRVTASWKAVRDAPRRPLVAAGRRYPCRPWTATTRRRSSPSGRRSGRTSAPGRCSNEPDDKPMAYVLEMLPYTSGEPHIGHLKNYAVGDAVAHFHAPQRRQRPAPDGLRRVRPARGEPRDQDGPPPAPGDGRVDRGSSGEQFREWGVSFDWTREVSSHQPEYYRWTQWIFLRLFERGLAYRKEAAVKWCPVDQTVLANEQVIDGRCERCGSEVEAQAARAVVLQDHRLRRPAARGHADDRVAADTSSTMQENWIGRSEGAEVVFRCEELGIDYPVFTTRPDTLFGATFFVLAPEHPDVLRLNDSPEVRDYVNHALNGVGRGARVTSTRRRRAWRSARRSPTRPPARRSRCSSPTTC